MERRGLVWVLTGITLVVGCGQEPPVVSSRKGMPIPMIGRSSVQPFLFDVKFDSRGNDATATVIFTNRGTKKETAILRTFEVNGVEPIQKLPMNVDVPLDSKKSVTIVFPGQKGFGYSHASYTYLAGTEMRVDNGPHPNLLFVNVGSKCSLRYDADFTEQPLDVSILSIRSGSENLIKTPLNYLILSGRSIELPMALPRPVTVDYKIKLHKNRLWKKETIFLDTVN